MVSIKYIIRIYLAFIVFPIYGMSFHSKVPTLKSLAASVLKTRVLLPEELQGLIDINFQLKREGCYDVMYRACLLDLKNSYNYIQFLLNKTGNRASTFLIEAIKHNDKEVVKLLIKAGINVNLKYEPQSKTPLMYAAKRNNKKIVKLLLKAGANSLKWSYNKHKRKQVTAGCIAKKKNHALIKTLIEDNQDVRSTEKAVVFFAVAFVAIIVISASTLDY